MDLFCSDCGKKLNEGTICDCQKSKPLVAQNPGYFTEENYYYREGQNEPGRIKKFLKNLLHDS